MSNHVEHKSKPENGAFCFSSLTRLDVLNLCSTLNNVLLLREFNWSVEALAFIAEEDDEDQRELHGSESGGR